MKRILIFLSLAFATPAFFAPTPVVAAIAVEGTASIGITGGTTANFAVQCGTNDKRFLVVGVSWYASTTALPSTFTYNGVALALIDIANDAGGNRTGLYKLVNATTGSNTLSFVSNTSDNIVVTAICFSDVDQTTPHGTFARAADITVGITVATNGWGVDFISAAGGAGTYTVGAGQTSRVAVDNGDNSIDGFMSTEAASGSVTMSWTDSPVACCANSIIALPLNAAAAVSVGKSAFEPIEM